MSPSTIDIMELRSDEVSITLSKGLVLVQGSDGKMIVSWCTLWTTSGERCTHTHTYPYRDDTLIFGHMSTDR